MPISADIIEQTKTSRFWHAIWPDADGREFSPYDYKRLFDFFESQTVMANAVLGSSSAGPSIQMTTLVARLGKVASDTFTTDKAVAVTQEALSDHLVSGDTAWKILSISLRIFLTLDIRFSAAEPTIPNADTKCVMWNSASTLSHAIATHFKNQMSASLS